MQEQEEEDQANNQQEETEAGGGIRLGNRRGKKPAKGGVDRSNLHKKQLTTGKAAAPSGGVLLGTYDEKDIEFMRNAVQQLC